MCLIVGFLGYHSSKRQSHTCKGAHILAWWVLLVQEDQGSSLVVPAPGKAMVGTVGNCSVSKPEFSCRSSAANYKSDEGDRQDGEEE